MEELDAPLVSPGENAGRTRCSSGSSPDRSNRMVCGAVAERADELEETQVRSEMGLFHFDAARWDERGEVCSVKRRRRSGSN
jgi:hypothetical protein